VQIIYMVLGRLTENTQKNGNQHRNFEIEIPKQTMDSVATVHVVQDIISTVPLPSPRRTVGIIGT
jgi:hypothetical protein